MVSAVAVLLLLAVYMVMTYRSVTKDIAERAGAQLTWALQLTDSGAELSLDTLAMRVDSLLGVAGLNRDVTLQEFVRFLCNLIVCQHSVLTIFLRQNPVTEVLVREVGFVNGNACCDRLVVNGSNCSKSTPRCGSLVTFQSRGRHIERCTALRNILKHIISC